MKEVYKQCLFGLLIVLILYLFIYAIAQCSYQTTGRSNIILKTNIFNLRQKSKRMNELKERLRPILTPQDFDRINVFDLQNHHSGSVGYTINKKDIYVCSRKEDGTPEEDDVINYVLLHEVSHAICGESIHHDELFLRTFATVLRKADAAGIPYREVKRICGTCVVKNAGGCD
jgi:hypothetical protein